MGLLTRVIKRGDSGPPLEMTLEEEVAEGTPGAVADADGTWWRPIDLSLVSEMRLRLRSPERVILAGPVELVDVDGGGARYAWEADDLASTVQPGDPSGTVDRTPGVYEVEAELTMTDTTVETVPNVKADNPQLQVDADLDPTAAEIAAGGG